jgi:hypothetical protein
MDHTTIEHDSKPRGREALVNPSVGRSTRRYVPSSREVLGALQAPYTVRIH